MSAPEIMDGAQRRLWLLEKALSDGCSLEQAYQQARTAETFIVGEAPDIGRADIDAPDQKDHAEGTAKPINGSHLQAPSHTQVAKAIREIVQGGKQANFKTVSAKVPLADATIRQAFRHLVDAKRIERLGAGRDTHYRPIRSSSAKGPQPTQRDIEQVQQAIESGTVTVTECPPAYATPIQGARRLEGWS